VPCLRIQRNLLEGVVMRTFGVILSIILIFIAYIWCINYRATVISKELGISKEAAICMIGR
jgi:hypothetical protein